MSDSELSYDESLDNLSLHTPSPDPLVGEDLTDINMDEIERNSLILIPQTQERLPGPSKAGTNKLTGRSGQSRRDRLNTLLILRAPKLLEPPLPTHNNDIILYYYYTQSLTHSLTHTTLHYITLHTIDTHTRTHTLHYTILHYTHTRTHPRTHTHTIHICRHTLYTQTQTLHYAHTHTNTTIY